MRLVDARFVLLVMVVTGAVLVAQGQGQGPQPAFRTAANYVRVDVYPTKDGVPVTDLTQADFEIIEDRAPQTIAEFEHVVVGPTGNAGDMRRDPQTVAESRDAVQNPRTRVFVIFLDTNHVDLSGSYRVRQPLIDALNSLIGPDDLFAS